MTYPLCIMSMVTTVARTSFVGLHGDGLGKRAGSLAVERLHRNRVRGVRLQTVHDHVFAAVLGIDVDSLHGVTVVWLRRRNRRGLCRDGLRDLVDGRQVSDAIAQQHAVAGF